MPLQTESDKHTNSRVENIKDKVIGFLQSSSNISSSAAPSVPSGDPNIDPVGNIFV